jgi:hypothetical protein
VKTNEKKKIPPQKKWQPKSSRTYHQGSERVRSLEIERMSWLRGPGRPETPLGIAATPSWTRSL